jgi:hypothetical protein
MCHDLVDHLRSEDCPPTLRADLDHLQTALLGGT